MEASCVGSGRGVRLKGNIDFEVKVLKYVLIRIVQGA